MLLTLGVNHNSAPVSIRERIAFTENQLGNVLLSLKQNTGIQGVAILSTCNRMEVYCDLAEGMTEQHIADWLHNHHQLDPETLNDYLYFHHDQESVRHLMRVATGLDSMVLGEPQILGQVKDAYHFAQQAKSLCKPLDRMFQDSFAVAKKVRTDTKIGASAVSVAYAAVSLANQIFENFNDLTVLLVGAGEMIELAGRHLHSQGAKRIIIANRTLSRAQTLASELDAYPIPLDVLPSHLSEADIVISSTGATEPLITLEMVKAALRKRSHKPVFMVDIAVPRDIEEKVGKLNDVYLYTVDDLKTVVDAGLENRKKAAEEAESLIQTHSTHFMQWLKAQDVGLLIQRLRAHADTEKEMLKEKARKIADKKGLDAALDFLANSLSNKLLHTPSSVIRNAGAQENQELIQAATQIFGLDNN
ncbi:MAG: glutamyl-tRNA reductase [bacterium]